MISYWLGEKPFFFSLIWSSVWVDVDSICRYSNYSSLNLSTLIVEAAVVSWHYQLKHTQLHERWVVQIVAGSWMTVYQALTVDCLGGSSCFSRNIGDSNASWTCLCHQESNILCQSPFQSLFHYVIFISSSQFFRVCHNFIKGVSLSRCL